MKTADLLEAAIPLEGEETVRAVASLTSQTGVPLSQSLPPVCLPYSPEFAPDQPDRGRKALAALSKTTGGRERLNLADIWTAIPRQPRYVPLSCGSCWPAILFLLEVFQRRTGFLNYADAPLATPEETAEGRSTMRPRAAVTQSGTAGTTADEPKTFRAPRKRRRTDGESNTTRGRTAHTGGRQYSTASDPPISPTPATPSMPFPPPANAPKTAAAPRINEPPPSAPTVGGSVCKHTCPR